MPNAIPTVESWADVEAVFIRAAACPKCGCLEHRTVRSERQTYAIVRKAICCQCKKRFLIIVEFTPLPENGSEDL